MQTQSQPLPTSLVRFSSEDADINCFLMYPEHYRESSETRPSKIKVNSFVILGRPVLGLL